MLNFRIHIFLALMLWVTPLGAATERNKAGGPGYEPPSSYIVVPGPVWFQLRVSSRLVRSLFTNYIA